MRKKKDNYITNIFWVLVLLITIIPLSIIEAFVDKTNIEHKKTKKKTLKQRLHEWGQDIADSSISSTEYWYD